MLTEKYYKTFLRSVSNARVTRFRVAQTYRDAVIGNVKSFRSYFGSLFSSRREPYNINKVLRLAVAINCRKSVRIIVRGVLSAELPDTSICVVPAVASSTRQIYPRDECPPAEVFPDRSETFINPISNNKTKEKSYGLLIKQISAKIEGRTVVPSLRVVLLDIHIF